MHKRRLRDHENVALGYFDRLFYAHQCLALPEPFGTRLELNWYAELLAGLVQLRQSWTVSQRDHDQVWTGEALVEPEQLQHCRDWNDADS